MTCPRSLTWSVRHSDLSESAHVSAVSCSPSSAWARRKVPDRTPRWAAAPLPPRRGLTACPPPSHATAETAPPVCIGSAEPRTTEHRGPCLGTVSRGQSPSAPFSDSTGTFPRLTQSHRPHRLSVSRWHPIEGLISCDLRLAEPARSSLRYVFGNDKRRSTDRSSGWR